MILAFALTVPDTTSSVYVLYPDWFGGYDSGTTPFSRPGPYDGPFAPVEASSPDVG